MTDHDAQPDDSPISECESTISGDQEDSLDNYRRALKKERITPGQWLKRSPTLPVSLGFQAALWDLYCLDEPQPILPGFQLLDVLGQGGMGQVFLAWDRALKRSVAIKEIKADLQNSSEARARFQREFLILARLDHSNIVKIFQLATSGGQDFMVMEYVAGGSLDEHKTEWNFSDPTKAIRLIAKLARAIAHAHETAQVIHRDLKPGNILFDSRGEPKISDFGLAKDLSDPQDYSFGRALGTGPYMAPEQVRGETPSPATDMWALGVILYYLVTGRKPFADAESIKSAPPPDMGSLVPFDLRTVCWKCLKKNPNERYPDGIALAKALDAIVLTDLGEPNPAAANPAANSPRKQNGVMVLPLVEPSLAKGPTIYARLKTLSLVSISVLVAVSLSVLAIVSAGAFNRDNQVSETEVMDGRHEGKCTSIAFLPDNQHAVSEDGGGKIVLWDLNRKNIGTVMLHDSQVSRDKFSGIVAVAPTGKLIASSGVPLGSDHMLVPQLHDSQNELKLVSPLAVFRQLGRTMAFSPDSDLIAAVDQPGIVENTFAAVVGPGDSKLVFLELKDGQWTGQSRSYKLDSTIKSLAFSPDGTSLLTSSGQDDLLLWSVKTGRIEKRIPAHRGGADCVGFSENGTRFYSASSADDTLKVWNHDEGSKIQKEISMTHIKSKLKCCAFSPTGRALTGHFDGDAVIWDLETGNPLARIRRANTEITAVALSRDGQMALVARSDHTVQLHRTGTTESRTTD